MKLERPTVNATYMQAYRGFILVTYKYLLNALINEKYIY